ncbi:MAG: hypothetical protein ACR2HR_08715 [Euzebya sp.]
MPTAISRFVVAVVGLHGLIHLLGVVDGFGLADVEQLTTSISSRLSHRSAVVAEKYPMAVKPSNNE